MIIWEGKLPAKHGREMAGMMRAGAVMARHGEFQIKACGYRSHIAGIGARGKGMSDKRQKYRLLMVNGLILGLAVLGVALFPARRGAGGRRGAQGGAHGNQV